MRFVAVILLFSSAPGNCELRDVVKSTEIDKMFARTQSLDVLTKPNLAVVFRVAAGEPGGLKNHPDADEFWFVRRGSAKISLAQRQYEVGAGDVVNAPRTTPYRIAPAGGRFEYVAVRIFPAERSLRIGIGAGREARPMQDVAAKAQIDATFATAEKNVTLHSAGAVLINHVIYKGTHGPWEVHQTCDDIYFVRLGTARAQLDGTLINGKEDSPGEIRGSGVTGARSFEVGPGDIVWIPRNTVHFMNPTSPKLGYLLVKTCD